MQSPCRKELSDFIHGPVLSCHFILYVKGLYIVNLSKALIIISIYTNMSHLSIDTHTHQLMAVSWFHLHQLIWDGRSGSRLFRAFQTSLPPATLSSSPLSVARLDEIYCIIHQVSSESSPESPRSKMWRSSESWRCSRAVSHRALSVCLPIMKSWGYLLTVQKIY